MNSNLTPRERMYVSFSGLVGEHAVHGTIKDVVKAWREEGSHISELFHALIVGKYKLADEGRWEAVDIVDNYLDVLYEVHEDDLTRL